MNDIDRIKEVYKNRKEGSIYSFLNLEVMYETFLRQKIIARYFQKNGFARVIDDLKLLDVGCGFGDSILEFQRMGFSQKNITGIELMEDRYTLASTRLNSTITIINGDLIECELEYKYDVVYVSLVFSSLLSDSLRLAFANRIKSLLALDGVLIVYDFVLDNPSNSDVKAFTLSDLKTYFPEFHIESSRTTIIPPISRFVSIHLPAALPLFKFITSHRVSFLTMRGPRS